jgi:hypothetical protein
MVSVGASLTAVTLITNIAAVVLVPSFTVTVKFSDVDADSALIAAAFGVNV